MNRRQLLIGVVILALVAVGIVAYLVFAPSGDADLQTSSVPKFQVTLSPYDRPQGDPRAPITMVEYAAPTCPVCAHFDMTMYPELKKDYIDTGKVYYVFRVYPLRPQDVAADAIARCLPADNYFQFIDLLYRNQPKWDPDGYNIPDVHAALIDMARIGGMDADRADKCMNDQAMQKKIVAVGDYAEKNYGVQGTPTFIVNGETAPYFETSDDVKKYLDSVLAKK
ncbi:MAG TPA: thioredoxin domain-containing protein [Rhizomicrobium sp.]